MLKLSSVCENKVQQRLKLKFNQKTFSNANINAMKVLHFIVKAGKIKILSYTSLVLNSQKDHHRFKLRNNFEIIM